MKRTRRIQYMVLIVSLVAAFSMLVCSYGEWEDKLQADISITVISKISEDDKNISININDRRGNLPDQQIQGNKDN